MPSDTTRLEIAAAAARLIAEDGADYATAKRKAAREVLGEGQHTRWLPDNPLVFQELRRYLQTFDGDLHHARLGALRRQAAQLMRNLAAFQPHLVGAVLNGTATAHSDLHLHLFVDSAKDVEHALLNEGLDFDVDEAPAGEVAAQEVIRLVLDAPAYPGAPERIGLELTVFDHDALRTAPRGRVNDASLHPVEAAGRADLAALLALLRDQHPELAP
jgi:hypothetical protein